jgi:uncharacterized SAM-binding protein YcdF (DUF218 family)
LSSTKIRKPAIARKPVRRSSPPRHRHVGWVGRSVMACVAVVLGLVAWAVIARDLAPKENTSQDQFDALIVLGYPADADGNPSPTELARVTEAVREYDRGVAPRLIMTGGAAHNRFVEAQVMARVAEAQGIPAGVIVEEKSAKNTIENACNSVRIMRSHGWQSAEVISSASHLPRAAMILGQLPLNWRVHAAPPVEPESTEESLFGTTLEILKTVHYLVWSQPTEPCKL